MSDHKVFDWVTIFLVKAGVPFVDYRLKDGCLWVKYEDIDGELIAELRKCGAQFTYSNKGSKATKRQPAWYLDLYPKQLKEPQPPAERKKKKHHTTKHESASEHPSPTVKAEQKTSRATSTPKEKDKAKHTRDNHALPDRPKKRCTNCAYLDTAKCGHGGLKVCDDWRLKEKLPEYIPPMRKGGSGWGSPQPEDSWSDIPYSIRNDLGEPRGSHKQSAKKKSRKRHRSK